MNSHFCKVGAIRPNVVKIKITKEKEEKYSAFIKSSRNTKTPDLELKRH